MQYTLGQAAKVTGKSKSVVQRAIKNGTISAKKDNNGQYQIDAAELHRVFPIAVPDTPEKNETEHQKNTELLIENAALKGRIDTLSELLEEIRSGRDKAEAQSSAWQAQAESLKLLVAPKKEEKKGFWRRLVG